MDWYRINRVAPLVVAAALSASACCAFAEPPKGAPPAPAKADGALPTGEAVLARYVEATGGKAAYDAIKTRTSTGTVEIPAQGLKGSVKSVQDDKGRVKVEFEFAQIGKVLQGSDGSVVWETTPMTGARLLLGIEREQFIRTNAFDADVNPSKYFASVTTVGVGPADGKDAYLVEVVTKGGDKETRYYDKETGFMVLAKGVLKGPQGDEALETRYSDYKDAGGIKMAFKSVSKVANAEQIVVITDVKSNSDISADAFMPPDDVKKLLEKGAGGGGAGGAGAGGTGAEKKDDKPKPSK